MYGAVNGTAVDSTDNFNAALKASLPQGSFTKRTVHTSGLEYAIFGTVYVRKGQLLDGSGSHIFMGSTGSFKLGHRSDDVEDTGGAPVTISNLWLEGGGNPVDAEISGYFVNNVFFSASSSGARLKGTDGVISDCVFDAGSTLALVSGRNITLTNSNFYTGSTQINISGLKDSVISNCVFNYASVAAIRWDGDTDTITDNVVVTGCEFMKNEQHTSTFNGFVWVRNVTSAANGELSLNNCNFRNCSGPAIKVQATGNHVLNLTDCTFNGDKTLSLYNQSTSMYALGISGSGKGNTFLRGCLFENLHDTPIQADSLESFNVEVYGAEFKGNSGNESMWISSSNPAAKLSIGDIKGDNKDLLTLSAQVELDVRGPLFDAWTKLNDGTYDYILVPYSGPTLLEAHMVANPLVAGNTSYRAMKSVTVSHAYDYNGSTIIGRLTSQDDFASNSPVLNFDLNLMAAYSTPVGGTEQVGVVPSGVVALYWPQAYVSEKIRVDYKVMQSL